MLYLNFIKNNISNIRGKKISHMEMFYNTRGLTLRLELRWENACNRIDFCAKNSPHGSEYIYNEVEFASL